MATHAGKASIQLRGGRAVPSVTMDRIAAVHADVVEAVIRTTISSPLPASEQDKLLARSCAEACDLLQDWLADHWWEQTRPAHDRPIKDYVPTQKEFAKFLGPMLKDSLLRASRSGMTIDQSLVDQAREKVAATARRFPRMGCQQLFDETRTRVTALQHEVCGLAAQFRPLADPAEPADSAPRGAWRRRARKALAKVSGVLLAVALAMAGASPHVAMRDAVAWEQATAHAAEVITVHYLAFSAEPGVHVAPRAGPRVR
jgi:hypothetical protein